MEITIQVSDQHGGAVHLHMIGKRDFVLHIVDADGCEAGVQLSLAQSDYLKAGFDTLISHHHSGGHYIEERKEDG